jgi:predicted nucleic acid-binding protein
MIFVLDTNILSAIMKLGPEPEVAAWMAVKDESLLFTTAISCAEILAGLAVMADGRRRRALEEDARVMFEECGLTVINPWEAG